MKGRVNESKDGRMKAEGFVEEIKREVDERIQVRLHVGGIDVEAWASFEKRKWNVEMIVKKIVLERLAADQVDQTER